MIGIQRLPIIGFWRDYFMFVLCYLPFVFLTHFQSLPIIGLSVKQALQANCSFCLKGLSKILDKVGNKFPQILLWKKTIIRHLYFASKFENTEKRLAVWRSVERHITNRHDHSNEPLLPKCLHAEMSDRPWLEAGETYKNWFILYNRHQHKTSL